MGHWWEFIEIGEHKTPKKVTKIPVRVLGIKRVVIVRTRKNKGIV